MSRKRKKTFTLDQYCELLAAEKAKIKHSQWRNFNGQHFNDPHTLMISMTFLMLRQMMAIMAEDHVDVNISAYAEKGFELAIDAISDDGWSLSKKP